MCPFHVRTVFCPLIDLMTQFRPLCCRELLREGDQVCSGGGGRGVGGFGRGWGEMRGSWRRVNRLRNIMKHCPGAL